MEVGGGGLRYRFMQSKTSKLNLYDSTLILKNTSAINVCC